MIRHIVCFKLDDSSESHKQKVLELMRSMIGKVPTVLELEAGADFLGSARSYDIALSVLLRDEAALEAYQQDPYHCGVVKAYMHAHTAASVSVDYRTE